MIPKHAGKREKKLSKREKRKKTVPPSVLRKRAKAEADRLFSLFIRMRDKQCQCCGTTYGLQCAHIASRRFHNTRWGSFGGTIEPEVCPCDNAIALCAACHTRFTNNPDAWVLWICKHLGTDEYLELLREAQKVAKPDYEETRQRLAEWMSA